MKTSAVSYIGVEGLGVPDERNFQTSEVTIVQQQRHATVTGPTKSVLLTLLAARPGSLYGYQLMAQTGLSSGSLYPMLARLRDRGLVEFTREDIDPHVEGRPARMYYRLTAAGTELAATLAQDSPARASSNQVRRFATLPDPMKRLLLALLADRSGSLYGYQLMAETGLPSGTLYPMLSRLMHDGWIAISREEIDPHLEGRPARTFCRLTGDGAELANEWVLESSARANSKRAADA
jgi:PadR family transcriptional regulator PadR